ncbi:hypothetical protein EDD86DRAFT_208646 [Gorgonomyces haynaldii]|nr:hypothetical protein EDD86DRAFT_208646 [Gorgonomyces haynaldii]
MFFLLSSVSAHFKLTAPPPRGFDEITQPTGPCGGFNTVGARTPLALKGNLAMDIADKDTTVNVFAGLSTTTFPTLIGKASFTALGRYQVPYDLTPLVSAGLKQGGQATIQIQVQGSDGLLFGCADITLSGGQTPSTTATAAPQESHSHATTTASASSASKTAAATASPTILSGATQAGVFGVAALAVFVL